MATFWIDLWLLSPHLWHMPYSTAALDCSQVPSVCECVLWLSDCVHLLQLCPSQLLLHASCLNYNVLSLSLMHTHTLHI